MSEIDEVLIKLFREQSSDPSDKNVLPLDGGVKIKKIAFDMFKVLDDKHEDLWKVESIDGADFLVRCTDTPSLQVKESGDWSAVANYDCDNVTLSYKSVPICAFSSDEYEFDKNSIFSFKSALLDIVEEDSHFVKNVIASQPSAKIEVLSNIFPEIKEIIK
jgi:hypothetical protein